MLSETVTTLDAHGWDEVYDKGTRCYVSRDADGELVLTRFGSNGDFVEYSFASLCRGPGYGLKGAALEEAINQYMTQQLDAVQDGEADTVEVPQLTDEDDPTVGEEDDED